MPCCNQKPFKTQVLFNHQHCGLAIGMACCIMIFLYTQHELSYDRYHKNADHIYRLAMNTPDNAYGREDSGIAKIPGPWGPTALHNLPEVKQMVPLQIFG